MGFGSDAFNMQQRLELSQEDEPPDFAPLTLPATLDLDPWYRSKVSTPTWLASDLVNVPRVAALSLLSLFGPRASRRIRDRYHDLLRGMRGHTLM